MELNIKLPEELAIKLKNKINEQPIYCVRTDIDRDGNYTDNAYIVATKNHLVICCNNDLQFFEIDKIDDVKCLNQVNGAVLCIVKGGEEYMLARCSMNCTSAIASVARGVNYLISGNYEKRITNNERQRYCPKCGGFLPGTKKCPKCDKDNRNFKRLLDICKPHTATLVIVSALMLLSSVLELGVQFVLRYFVDEHFLPQQASGFDLTIFFLLYAGVMLAGNVVYLLRAYLCGKMGIKISFSLREKINNHLQKLSLSFMNRRSEGELLGRVTWDTNHVKMFITDCFCNMFTQSILLICLAVLMLIMNWKLALASFAFAPLIVLFARTFWPRVRRMYHSHGRKNDRTQNKLQDVLSGIRIVKTYGKEKAEIEQFSKMNEELAAIQRRNEKFFATFFPFLSLIMSLGSYLVVYLGGLDVLTGNMTPGQLMQFVAYSGMLLGPLGWMSFLPRRIIMMTTSMERIYDILDEEPEIASSSNAKQIEFKGNIKLDNIVFGYRSYEPVLNGISLDVKSGEMIGLVGASGCGKSTLINLIMRLYDVDDGAIYIDGINIKDIDVADYHRQIGVVLQDTFLFAGTVLDNIRFAKPDATLAQIISAAKSANAHEFICRLPDGYNTYIGEKGHMLSGGEKQRISIARAILNDPKILILDEATSALDTESEYQVQQALERLRKNRTTFAIAHRLSTLRCADRIIVINDHKIVEIGTHNELIKKKGIYYSLVMAQLQMNKTAKEK